MPSTPHLPMGGWKKIIFFCYLQYFSTYLHANDIERPVLLFMDGHSSHFSLESATFCAAQGILLYCLPPHASHILQPLDVGVFSSLKADWRKRLFEWQRLHPGTNFQKSSFPGVFRQCWTTQTTADKAKNSWRAGTRREHDDSFSGHLYSGSG